MGWLSKTARYLRPTAHWQKRCVSCGKTSGVMTTRVVRIALPFPALIVGYCRACRGLRLVMMEPAAPEAHVPRRGYL